MASSRKSSESAKPRRPPATTIEARENQLISLASDLAETQLAEGNASSQVITHFLKLGSVRENLEREKLRRENLLLEARVEGMKSSKNSEELYANALKAMRAYKGDDSEDDEDA